MAEDEKKPLLTEGAVINGKWTILDHIATGGKGEVYLAKQRDLERRVALKIISRAFLESLADDESEVAVELERFRREVQVMARLRHPNILQVFDYDQVNIDGSPLNYLVMEYVPGPTLALTMPEEGLGNNEETVKSWIRQYFLPVCNGMEAVHAQGVIHRDVKPANVLIDDGTPKIADFGLAGGNVRDCVTRDHHILGTLPYMAEEQFLDLNLADTRADVFSLGRVLFEATVGKKALKKAKPFETVGLEHPASAFQKRLDRIIRQASAKNVAKRLPSVRTLRQALEELVAEAPTKEPQKASTHHTLWLVAAVILAVLSGAGLLYHFLWQIPSRQDGPVAAKAEKAPSPPAASVAPQASPTAEPPAGHHEGETTPQPSLAPGETPPPRFSARDGSTFILISGGKTSPGVDGAPETVRVPSFYMQETQVTNHQFVMFLNLVRDRVTVEKGAVSGADGIWLLLGEATPWYEPITYRQGMFVMDPAASMNPVVRVSVKGARAFAEYYGFRLPTVAEWRLAQRLGEEAGKVNSLSPSPIPIVLAQGMEMDGWWQERTPPKQKQVKPAVPAKPKQVKPDIQERKIISVAEAPANRLGIRGLGTSINEWSTMEIGTETHYFVTGGPPSGPFLIEPLRRQAWEGFADVGFRTVIPLPQLKPSL
ncbi:serine/threonine protein kinase [Desulfovibrio sp. DV]|uniref:bifunctional serine/threonine-protein kinase/formylglycine-generating enzyme family protein n=1 Tax=Desulfovibrio sp. DV TaxID=1844708 RepID=UPI00094B91D9|nr:bifunctional serine/threonine-protein kinase/formylglycine-generating enzyme family protein [Desulfovibrio sp. DV]OLN30009.1 serine/threonine protein kinase [Desulfovibrio sp. DV]